MNRKEVFGLRLRQARETTGMSLRKLEAHIGKRVSHTQLAKYENGVDMPSSKVLLTLCTALSCSPDQLFRPLYVGMDGIAFRKKSKMPKRVEKAIKATVQNRVDRYFELENLVGIPVGILEPVGLPGHRPDEAENAAERVREDWHLGYNPIANLVECIEEHHVKVEEVDATEDFDGCSGWGKAEALRFPVMVLSRHLQGDLARKRFTTAHELGHLILDADGLDVRQEENVCHRFAGALLLPQSVLFEHFGRKRQRVEWQELAMLKKEYGISMAAILHRLHDLGIINERIYRQMSIDRNARGWRKHEPAPYIGTEEGLRFNQLLYRGIAEDNISLSKAAELAGINLEEMQAALAPRNEGQK